MKQVVGMVSDDAKSVLQRWQSDNMLRRQDAAIESLLLRFEELRVAEVQRRQIADRKESANHIDELTED